MTKVYYKHNREKIQERKVPSEEKKEANMKHGCKTHCVLTTLGRNKYAADSQVRDEARADAEKAI